MCPFRGIEGRPRLFDQEGMRRLILLACLVAAATCAATASASEIVTRDATGVSLKVDAKGYALVSYKAGGALKRTLLWGAVNANAPTRGGKQVAFKRDFSGGWGTFHTKYWATMKNACGRYDGPPLAWAVTACKAPDGSYWALQSWQRMLPNLGETPWKQEQSVWELHLSHWTGELPQLALNVDWSYSGRFHHVFGTYTYGSSGVYGFKSTSSGVPLDDFGRNIYLDTFDSAYGSGWKRENSFLSHAGGGSFCYGFYPHPPYAGYPAGDRPAGHGAKYRATAIGPGVTPDVMWTGTGLPDFDKSNAELVDLESQMNAAQLALGDPKCVHP
jgi:hypothetical protein